MSYYQADKQCKHSKKATIKTLLQNKDTIFR